MTVVHSSDGALESSGWRRLLAALFVALCSAAYYGLYFLPPRSMGERDPDRYFHLGLSRLMADQGLLRSLPQAEDLGWGKYFPDKEFLFHQLSAGMGRIAGDAGVLSLVPLLGVATLLVLQAELSRRIAPFRAALLVLLAAALTPAFLFRLTLLRPHLLAILLFTLLVVAVVRGRGRLAAMAAALFALSYHAFYVVALVAAAAWLFRGEGGLGKRTWAWILAGLVVGIIVNPYFPSNLEMSLLHLRLALGEGGVPAAEEGIELRAYSGLKLVLAYGFIPASLLLVASRAWIERIPLGKLPADLRFAAILTLGFWLLGTRSPRAMEYAMPACILMVGYAIRILPWRQWLPACALLLVGLQGYVAQVHYRWYWRENRSHHAEYAAVISQIPAEAAGRKVFNCEWWAGSFVLHDRPDLRFVALLEPAFLWNADSRKYLALEGLNRGAFDDPRLILKGVFKADYVLCASKPLIRQMESRRADFAALPGTASDRVRLFAVRPD